MYPMLACAVDTVKCVIRMTTSYGSNVPARASLLQSVGFSIHSSTCRVGEAREASASSILHVHTQFL
jgi:hypothetical protein